MLQGFDQMIEASKSGLPVDLARVQQYDFWILALLLMSFIWVLNFYSGHLGSVNLRICVACILSVETVMFLKILFTLDQVISAFLWKCFDCAAEFSAIFSAVTLLVGWKNVFRSSVLLIHTIFWSNFRENYPVKYRWKVMSVFSTLSREYTEILIHDSINYILKPYQRSGEGLVWLTGAVVCLIAENCGSKLFTDARNGRLHSTLRASLARADQLQFPRL